MFKKAVFSLTVAASLQDAMALRTGRKGHNPSEPVTSCTVDGITWSSGVLYITGQQGQPGSIYASCDDSDKPKCYKESRIRDLAQEFAEEVNCNDEKVIHASRRRLGVYVSGQDRYWPQGVACYSWGSYFTADQQDVFRKAMEEYHTKTKIRFIPFDECEATYGSNTTVCGGCKEQFKIVNKRGNSDCYATLGYAPEQDMFLNFGNGCFNGGGHQVATHELGHVIGLIHEHIHPQREVIVLRDEITLSADNYSKSKDSLVARYTRNSIMHYDRDTGICIPLDPGIKYCDIDETEADGCVVPTKDHCDSSQDKTFGQAETLGDADIETISRAYGNEAKRSDHEYTYTRASVPQPPSLESISGEMMVAPNRDYRAYVRDKEILPVTSPEPTAPTPADPAPIAPALVSTTQALVTPAPSTAIPDAPIRDLCI